MQEMPRYRCHKVVSALKIKEVRKVESGGRSSTLLVPVDGAYASIVVGEDFLRHKPQAGGYLVVYEDGYQSFSPAAPFEAGYSLLKEDDGFGNRSGRTDWQIARVCHDANRAYALATYEDPSAVWPPWESAPESIRESAITGVRHALLGATPEQLHESWLASKAADGWTFGPVRDNAAKVHPCMVPYGELPAAQRAKDALFHAIVEALR